MNFEITIPSSMEHPKDLDSWGFITAVHGEGGVDYQSKFWFGSQTEMLFYLCLATSEYAPDNRSIEKLLIPAIESLMLDSSNLRRTIETIESAFDNELNIVWFGKFSDLLQGPSRFAVRLRSAYLPYAESRLISISEADRFKDWLGHFDGFVSAPL